MTVGLAAHGSFDAIQMCGGTTTLDRTQEVFSSCPRRAGHRNSALPEGFSHSPLDRFLAGSERRVFHIAEIATGDADEAMNLVNVARSAAPSRPTASATAISSGLLARIIHEGSSSPTHPSPILWGRVREGVRDGHSEA